MPAARKGDQLTLTKRTRAVRIAAAALTLGLVLALSASTAGAAPSAEEGSSSYIVVLKDSSGETGRSKASEHSARYGARVTRVYDHALNGYAAQLTQSQRGQVASDPDVAYVERDGVITIDTTQTNPPWGLDRIDQRGLPLNGTFVYTNTGAGVTAYVIDTGIRFSHSQFGSRATSGFDAIDGGTADDCNGHGTHVAGTVGGSTYGVAKSVSLVAVRVLNCSGSGSYSQVIAGVDWVTGNHGAGQAAVANMSLGGSRSSSLDTAVRNSIADGVSYAIAAGNSNVKACNQSPARVAEAMTVGATGSGDRRASWSNHGSCLDLFAPGVGIASAWHTSDSATNTISGTSMATPHVAGVAAQYLQSNPAASPSQVWAALSGLLTQGIVTSSKSAPYNDLLYTNL